MRFTLRSMFALVAIAALACLWFRIFGPNGDWWSGFRLGLADWNAKVSVDDARWDGVHAGSFVRFIGAILSAAAVVFLAGYWAVTTFATSSHEDDSEDQNQPEDR